MSDRKEFIKKVAEIQKELKAPKSQFNKFGGYNYRNQEDILEAVKPLLGDLVLTVNDDIVEVGGRVYVKATATITDGENSISNTAFARESENKKGMDESMCTGTASSYGRKYSLNGLFLIDDTKDADSDEFQKVTSDKKDKSAPSDKPSRFARKSKDEPKVDAKSEVKGASGIAGAALLLASETAKNDSGDVSTTKVDQSTEQPQTPSKTSFRRLTRNK